MSLTITRANAGVADIISRAYDVVGNVTAETQTLNGASGLAGSGTQTLSYDAANRVTDTYFGPSNNKQETRDYTYDADSNRTSVKEDSVTFYYFYDATDELRAKNTTNTTPPGTTCASGNVNFCYDTLGNLRSSVPSTPDSSSLLATDLGLQFLGRTRRGRVAVRARAVALTLGEHSPRPFTCAGAPGKLGPALDFLSRVSPLIVQELVSWTKLNHH